MHQKHINMVFSIWIAMVVMVHDPAGTDCAELSGSESDTRMKYALVI